MNSLIYYKQCTSTQDEIIDFINTHNLIEDFLGVYSFHQNKGRGQYGNSWETNPDENLAFSFVVKTNTISLSDILFNYYTAIIIRDFVANLAQTEVLIKWPNDIIMHNKKIGGMLFEKKKNYFIVGIGLNILQQNFENLPKAGSLLTQTQLAFDLKSVAESLYQYLVKKITQNSFPTDILAQYNQHLYKRDKIAVFEKNKVRQNGIIRNADENGFLWIDLEDEGLQKFFHKEIQMCY